MTQQNNTTTPCCNNPGCTGEWSGNCKWSTQQNNTAPMSAEQAVKVLRAALKGARSVVHCAHTAAEIKHALAATERAAIPEAKAEPVHPSEWMQAVYDACAVAFIDCGPESNPWRSIEALIQAHIDAALAARSPVAAPVSPAQWDEWAMNKACEFVKRTEEVNHPRAMLVSALYCALIQAMEHAAPDAEAMARRDEQVRSAALGLLDFAKFVKKCLAKNNEYAPLSHQEVDTVIANADAALSQPSHAVKSAEPDYRDLYEKCKREKAAAYERLAKYEDVKMVKSAEPTGGAA